MHPGTDPHSGPMSASEAKVVPTEDSAAAARSRAPSSDATPPEFSRRRFVAGILLVGGLAFAGIAVAVAARGGLDALRTGAMPNAGLLLVALGLIREAVEI